MEHWSFIVTKWSQSGIMTCYNPSLGFSGNAPKWRGLAKPLTAYTGTKEGCVKKAWPLSQESKVYEAEPVCDRDYYKMKLKK